MGLGNPEPKYDTTRHNAGFMAIDHIAQKTGCKVNQLKFKSLCGMCEIEGKKGHAHQADYLYEQLGEAVREAAAFYKIPPEKTIIIFDDISLDVGKMRIRRKGSDGGHNGIKSIIYLTGATSFRASRWVWAKAASRLRFGSMGAGTFFQRGTEDTGRGV